MSQVIQLFVVILGLSLFSLKSINKIVILLFCSICLNDVTIDFIPFGKSNYFLVLCFILSELPHFKCFIKELKHSFLWHLMIMMVFATIILIIYSPHFHSFIDVIRLIIMELIGKYFVICYSYFSIKKEKDLKTIINAIKPALYVLTFFGIYNYMYKHSLWLDWIFPSGTLEFDDANRFRVQSMFMNPFCYGYICVLINILYIYSLYKRYNNKQVILPFLCCIFGILTCGCRTVLVVWLISVFVFYCFILPLNKILFYSAGGLSVVILFFMLFPSLINPEILDSYSKLFEIDVNSDGGNGYGSSLGMRLLQFTTVLYYISGNVFFGRGRDFFAIDMGWAEGGFETLVDHDLWGLEGVFMNLLLERGLVGLFFWFVFYGTLFYFFYRRRNIMKYEVSMGMAILFSYLAFANMTGELSSVFPTLLLLGIVIKLFDKRVLMERIQ